MSSYLPYIVSGLVTGSIIAIAALGLVLSYKTSGLLNFAHGALAAAGAYVFFDFNTREHVPWPVAAVLAVLVFGAGAGLVMERLSRGLAGVSTAFRVVATVGVLIAVRQIAIIRYGATAIVTRHFLPTGTHRFGGAFVTDEQLIIGAVALASAVSLYLYFRMTRMGRAMRAVVDDPALLDMTGLDPGRVRRTAWIISCSFAALSGVLFAPEFVLDPTILTLLVLQAFSAAAIGLFATLPVVYAGGLAVGVLQQVSTKFAASHQQLAGLPASVPFLVLLGVLLFAGPRLRELGHSGTERIRNSRSLHGRARLAPPAALSVVLFVVPWIVGTKLSLWTSGLAQAVLFLSLALLVRAAGMVSLCQVTFAAVGAACFGHLAGAMGVPWFPSLLLAGLCTVPFGAAVAIPAIRLSGLYLALATFGFGILVQQELYTQPWLFGGFGKVLNTPRPGGMGLGTDRGFYYVVAVVLVLSICLVAAIGKSRLGRLLRGLADSPTALNTHGVNINTTRVLVFCISAFLAGISGAMYSQLNGKINGDGFPAFTSLILVAVLAVAGRRAVPAALVASAAYVIIPGYIASARLNDYLGIIFGVAAVVAALNSSRTEGTLGRSADPAALNRHRSRLRARSEVPAPFSIVAGQGAS